MANIRDILQSDHFYHIYNHAVGTENLFRVIGNYQFFLRKFQEQVLHVADCYAYCLMPNHIHFLVKIKPEDHLLAFLKPKGEQYYSELANQFGNWFNAYTKSFNKKNNRRGGLFVQSFRRIHVNSDDYLRNLIMYVHLNPVHHGFTDKPGEWKFSSYDLMLSEEPTFLKRDFVLEIFGGKENFIYLHRERYELEDKYKLE